MGKLSIEVIDTVRGKPASGVKVSLYRISDEGLEPLGESTTDKLGQTEPPLLEGKRFTSGHYQLIASTADYFVRTNTPLASIPFLDDIVLRFGIADHNQDFDLTLQITPYGYTFCRG